MSHTNNHITFFVDPSWRREGWLHVPLLFPFWGIAFDKERSPFGYAAFERHPMDISCYIITDNPEEADMVLMPYRHTLVLRHEPALLDECLSVSKRIGKPLLIDGVGDIEFPISDGNIFVLRYGGYRFLRRDNEIILPVYADDLLERYRKGVLSLRKKTKIPSICFAGWTNLSLKQYVRTVIKELPNRLRGIIDDRYRACVKGVLFRRRALSVLRASNRVQLNVLERQSFSGHSATASGDMSRLREEFVNNIVDNDYALDIRGDANASTRLFEVLSLGRIPVIVDTERNFPFSDEIDYDSFSVRVDFRDISKLPDIIADFHEKVTPEHFEEMQRNGRKVFVDYFRADAFPRHVVRELIEKAGIAHI